MRTLQLLLLVALSTPTALCSSPPQSQAPPTQASIDEFVGSWILNPDKSSRGVDRESLNIEPKGSEFRFTIDVRYDNGTELNYWFVTDMKGGCVDETQVNGKPMSSKACLLQVNPTSIAEDNWVEHRQYKIDKRGNTLTVHTKFKLRANGREVPDERLVF